MIKTVLNGHGKVAAFALLSGFLLISSNSQAVDLSETQVNGTGGIEQRYFLQDALFVQQQRTNLSAYLEAEVYSEFNDGDDSILFKPFFRFDQNDEERTHGDIRELLWLHVGEDWELRTGISKVFWGQTESLHLVDIINQTDAIEAVDGEDKLGQPMVNLSLIRDWGTTSFFILPYFRERTFAGVDGRPRSNWVIDTDNPVYESSDEEKHVDWALRWQRTLGDWEIGLSYFNGTSREPVLIPVGPESNEDAGSVTVYYPQIKQVGLDVLAIMGSWIIKFEGINRQSTDEDFIAAVGGFEYTNIGVFNSSFDLGWLMEYQYDDRDSLTLTAAQNDLMLGTRIVYNDIDGTEILIGMVQDLDESSSRSAFVEASSRINDHWKWKLDAWLFSSDVPEDLLYQYRRDDFVELTLEYYF